MTTLRWFASSIIFLFELFVLLNLLFYKKSKFQYLIKDQSTIQDSAEISFSYARSQLLWWTIIILTCLTISFLIQGDITGLLNSSTLILLGISAVTTTTGSMIDKSDENNNAVRHQNQKSQGFIVDILSDENGISIHRFQALIFNLMYGFIFIIGFVESSGKNFVQFDEFTLGLIGLSSAGFIALKFQENRE